MQRAGFLRSRSGPIVDRLRPLLRSAHSLLVLKNFVLFLWTGLLVAFFLASIQFFAGLQNFSTHKKQAFQGITGALVLLISLSVFDAFKTLAKEIPDFIFAHSRYGDEHLLSPGERRERELVAKVEDWFNVVKLIRVSLQHQPGKSWKPMTATISVFWICLFLATQTMIALANVAAGTVDGVDFTGAYIDPYNSMVSVPNLTCHFSFALDGNHSCPLDLPEPGMRDLGAIQFTAHTYGLASLTAGQAGNTRACRGYNELQDILETDGVRNDSVYGDYVPPYYCRRTPDRQQFAYRFLEYNPNDNSSTYPSFSKRLITASSGTCRRYEYVSDKMNGGLREYTIKAANGTEARLVIAEQNEALGGTTYVYEGARLPPDAVDMQRVACGDRCIWVWAHLSRPLKAPGPNVFYQCPITVGPVTNVERPEHDVSDAMARYSAAAIALSGRQREPTGKDAVWKQSQYFSYGSPWSLLQEEGPDSLDLVGAKIAEFALRSLAMLAQRNPRINIEGRRPELGTHLEIRWDLLGAIAATVLAVHLALFLAITYVSRPSARAGAGDAGDGEGGRQAVPQDEAAEDHRLEPYSGRSGATPDVSSLSESRRGMTASRHNGEWSRSSISEDDDLGPERAQH